MTHGNIHDKLFGISFQNQLIGSSLYIVPVVGLKLLLRHNVGEQNRSGFARRQKSIQGSALLIDFLEEKLMYAV